MRHKAAPKGEISESDCMAPELAALCRGIVSGSVRLFREEGLDLSPTDNAALVLGWWHRETPSALVFVDITRDRWPSVFAIEGVPGEPHRTINRKLLHRRMRALAHRLVTFATVPADFELLPPDIALDLAKKYGYEKAPH